MHMSSLPPRRSFLAAALSVTALAACTGQDGDPAPGTASAPSGSDGGVTGATSAPAATVRMPHGDQEIAVAIPPLVRTGDLVVLTLDLTGQAATATDPQDIMWGALWAWTGDEGKAWEGIRLVDLDGDRIAPPARDAQGQIVMAKSPVMAEDPEQSASLQLVFADPGTEQICLYLPKIGLISGLPITDGAVPERESDDDALEPSRAVDAPLLPAIGLSRDLVTSVRDASDTESVSVSIGSEVLFDSSSAELSAQAQAALDEAAARILEREPAEVLVVGHTDDVDDDAFNLDLSMRRAQSVVAALGTRLDPAQYPLRAEGKGETEPVADNTTADGRAANRRVVISIASPARETTEEAVQTELPEFAGTVARGDEGVRLPEMARPSLLTVREARMLQEHLVVALDLVFEDEEVDSTFGSGGFFPVSRADAFAERLALGHNDGGLGVLVGSVMTLPIYHAPREEGEPLVPLTDLYTVSRLDGGVHRTIELVYPRGIAGVEPGAVIALQWDYGQMRLTDIPVSA